MRQGSLTTEVILSVILFSTNGALKKPKSALLT
jgi:hypothetical protein